MNRATRISATVASSACLVVGFASVAGASPASILGTGNNSSSEVTQTRRVRTNVNNNAHIRAVNNNPQYAESGSASSDDNRDGSDVTTGGAENVSDLAGTVRVNSSAATAAAIATSQGANSEDINGDAVIEDTGNNTSAQISQRTSIRTNVNNNSDVEVVNNNSQAAVTGNARATNNRDAGSVVSGTARNDSLTTFDVNVTY